MKSIFALCLISATSLFAQEMNSEEEPSPPPRPSKSSSRNKFSPGYNAPDRTAVRSSLGLNGSLSFLYWMPMEENLEPGMILDTTASAETKGDVINFDFSYKPGLKVGIGFGTEYDSWDLSTEYTHLRSTMKNSPNIKAGSHISPILLMPQITGTNNYDSVREKWNLALDFLDASASRSYFNGTQLKFCYFFGLRGAWIYQQLKNQFGSIGNTVRGIDTLSGIVDSCLKTDSWAVGPRTGLNGNWEIGKGARVFGNGSVDLLFTRYQLSRKETSTLLNFTYKMSQKEINTLKAHIDLELGLGWGSHFCDSKWHIDFSAAYGFQAFFGQNMFRTYYNNSSYIGEAPHGNLYIQGLNVTVRFDF